ncbi:PIR Superfamily Protein [Plasmodium ovale wallikeri]|uniref:PIR Superfamily Protein n=1 Tax=Plasmodium ovale wallikeri TaxID=864142 RepID=A0A1A9AI70_PLAOA|nr:PIR Superfamily Protein [Plasmodium ovale wallikeri]
MSTIKDHFTYEEFENDNNFLKNLLFAKIYKNFNSEYINDSTAIDKCGKVEKGLSFPYDDKEIILKFCKILYIIIAKDNGWHNELDNEIPDDYKMYCLHLKYWLYEKVVNLGPMDLKIEDHFEKWKGKLETEINYTLKNPCTFNELSWNDINKLRRLYAFALIYYSNLNIFHTQNNIKGKYLDYLGKGLNEYHESINRCSKKNEQDNYCKEFKEFQDIYKLDKIYWENSTSNTEYVYNAESNDNCPLSIESLENPLRLIYQEKDRLLRLSDEPTISLNNSVISTSSAIGTTVGISAFLLYLYKYTTLGSLFRNRTQKDNTMFLKVDQETQNFTIPISESEQTNFGNSEYSISYYSVGNT